ncbi:nuclear transport factor 2 family protein, partial [Streptomyces sp. SID7804]|nr:nuclear transport factor 2 family protein [Streptomyces sp. SID7804]
KHLDEDGGIVFRIVGDKMTDLDECVADIDAMNDFWS